MGKLPIWVVKIMAINIYHNNMTTRQVLNFKKPEKHCFLNLYIKENII